MSTKQTATAVSLERAAIAQSQASQYSYSTGKAQGNIGGCLVQCEYRVTRRNAPSGVTQCMQTIWYIDGKRASAAKVAAL